MSKQQGTYYLWTGLHFPKARIPTRLPHKVVMRARVSSHTINAALDYQAPSIMFITNRFHMEIHKALTQPKLHKHKLATPHPCFTPFKTDTVPKALPSNHPEGNRKLTGPVNPVWACRARDYTSHKHRGARGREGVGVQDSGSAQLSPGKPQRLGSSGRCPSTVSPVVLTAALSALQTCQLPLRGHACR